MLKAKQKIGDAKLEFVAFPNAAALGLEVVGHNPFSHTCLCTCDLFAAQAIKGNGRRVHQGKGPYRISFLPVADNVRCYFQVDGEFFIMTQPDYIGIRWLKDMRVLVHGGKHRNAQFSIVN
eukprot:GHVN01005858.1.p2 GENE.GHVN01005858.1~~GHVN01005858.1.p2  ORF type:complete len:121 (-),score=10.43 GHVN01005858.1:220-582(-)